MKRRFIHLLLLSSLFSQSQWSRLDPNLVEVWTIEEYGLRESIIEAINYFSEQNPADSIKKIEIYDELIVIESLKARGQIFQLAYGNRGNFEILDKEEVMWVLSEKQREYILPSDGGRKEYFFINDKSYLTNRSGDLDLDYLNNRNYWTNRDIYLSVGSRTLFDKLILRLTSVGGINLTPLYALSINVGNEILGFPSSSQGVLHFGLLNKVFETGIQFPIPSFVPGEYSHFVIPSADTSKTLSGGFGGYGRISIFGLQTQLSFSDFVNNQYVTENVQDSTFIDFMQFSFLATKQFQVPIKEFAYALFRIGGGMYEIAHRSILDDGSISERTFDRNMDPLDASETTFMGGVVRLDVISKVKRGTGSALTTLPFVEVFGQINAYKSNKSMLAGAGINYKNLGVDFTYKIALDDVDWMPDSELFVSVNLAFNRP